MAEIYESQANILSVLPLWAGKKRPISTQPGDFSMAALPNPSNRLKLVGSLLSGIFSTFVFMPFFQAKCDVS